MRWMWLACVSMYLCMLIRHGSGAAEPCGLLGGAGSPAGIPRYSGTAAEHR